MDVPLQPGDIVYAVPKKFAFFRDVIQSAVATFATTLSNSAATDVWQEKLDPFDFGGNRPQN